jgi:ribosome small subunit-dependent GTPase A
MRLKGRIIKGIGGFYYVETESAETEKKIYECSARGKFRKEKITPYAGDWVFIETAPDFKGVIDEILERTNYLIRPPVANIDNLFIIASMKYPTPDLRIIDKTIAAAELRDINPILVITKSDLANAADVEKIKEIYKTAKISCFSVSIENTESLEDIRELLKGTISAFTGNSGVGKSTLLNRIFSELNLPTGEISEKLGRGRHTTREVELHKTEFGGYVADTPGFSTFDVEKYKITEKEQLIHGFREFMPFFGKCKFNSCLHIGEPDCAVLNAVKSGNISKSRYDSYMAMYEEIKDIKPWQTSKNA